MWDWYYVLIFYNLKYVGSKSLFGNVTVTFSTKNGKRFKDQSHWQEWAKSVLSSSHLHHPCFDHFMFLSGFHFSPQWNKTLGLDTRYSMWFQTSPWFAESVCRSESQQFTFNKVSMWFLWKHETCWYILNVI